MLKGEKKTRINYVIEREFLANMTQSELIGRIIRSYGKIHTEQDSIVRNAKPVSAGIYNHEYSEQGTGRVKP